MTTFEQSQEAVKNLFKDCHTPDAKYQKIIEIGSSLPAFPAELKTPERVVKGCQNLMYFDASLDRGCMRCTVFSEALISKGLAALLLQAYDGQPPETLLTCPPLFLEELGIPHILSPSRSNGLRSLFLKMQQAALQLISQQTAD